MGHSIQMLSQEHILLHDFQFEVIGGAILGYLPQFQGTSETPLDDDVSKALVTLWTQQLEMPLNGCIDLKLDTLVKSKSTLTALIALSKCAKEWLLEDHKFVTQERLNNVLLFKAELPDGGIERAKIERPFDHFTEFLTKCLAGATQES